MERRKMGWKFWSRNNKEWVAGRKMEMFLGSDTWLEPLVEKPTYSYAEVKNCGKAMCVQGLTILLFHLSHLPLLCSMVTILNYLCTPQWGSLSLPSCLPTCLFIALPVQLVNKEPSQCLPCPLSVSIFFFPPRGSTSPSFSCVYFFVPISMSASILP